jgi:hypothetical protein
VRRQVSHLQPAKIATHLYAQRGQADGATSTTVIGSTTSGNQPRHNEMPGPDDPIVRPSAETERDATMCAS